MWQKQILVPLWTVHLIIFLAPIASLLILIIRRPTFLYYSSWLWRIHTICLLVSFLLEWCEILQYKRKKLTPLFYFSSQFLKSLSFTWDLIDRIKYWHKYPPKSIWVWSITIASTCTFYIGFAYAIYVLLRHRRLQRSFFAKHSSQYSSYENDEPQDRWAAFMPPRLLNSSSQIRSQRTLLMKMVQWTNRNPIWLNRLPSSFSAFLSTALFILRYAISFPLIILMLPFYRRLPGEAQNPQLVLENDHYKNWEYVRPSFEHRDIYTDAVITDEENVNASLRMDTINQPNDPPSILDITRRHPQSTPSRDLGPRYLCFLTTPSTEATDSQYVVRKVEDSQIATETDYVFVSYTRDQFFTRNPNNLSHDDLKIAATRDRSTLVDYAITAAKEAEVPAFWIDFECVRPKDGADGEDDLEDVYRICDIVRAAHSMIIVVGPPLDTNKYPISNDSSTRSEWLLNWGKSIWTVPEALLCPSEHRISIYDASDSVKPEKVAKRNLAGRVWEDANVIRQLMDHYEGNLRLSQLELISIALECLERRPKKKHRKADVAYALMGLLRLRVNVDEKDSEFETFAKLSLANDSDKILERMLCLKSPDINSAWYDMRDVWNAKLWHIQSLYHIADIRARNTITIAGARGTSIDWESLKQVDWKSPNTGRTYRWHYIRWSTVMVFAYCFVLAMIQIVFWLALEYGGFNSKIENYQYLYFLWFGAALLLFGTIAIPVPALLYRHFQSNIALTQARLFGIKGRPNLGEIEVALFGSNRQRFRWDSDNSADQEDTDRVAYTIIDTLSCTATLIHTRNPPTMTFVGASEGGMLRLILCSFNATVGAFVEEDIIRMESAALQQMPRLDRFRYAIASADDNDDMIDIPDIPEFITID